MAKKNEIEKKEQEVIEEPVLAKEFEYENVGNVKYDIPKATSIFDLKAQVPFRMIQNGVKTVSAGIKVRIPEGHIGLVLTDSVLDAKTQVCVLGAPIVIRPELEAKEVMITLKMFGAGYKIFNMGDKLGEMLILPAKEVKVIKK